jgi:hypothetical protein
MKIREVYPGLTGGEPEFVELQMHAAGQNLVSGHSVSFYDAAGGLLDSYTFSSNVPSGTNQSSILVANNAAESAFGVNADLELPTNASRMDPAGGAACFENIDCVSWGAFGGSLPSPTGTPAAAVPDGSSLERSIAPNCATLLEGADDTNNSSVDFALATPSPRNNATPPTETACGPGGGGGGAGTPETKITKQPNKRTENHKAKFRFTSSESGSTFQCKLDKGDFESCDSPFKEKVAEGRHKFLVRAVDPEGNVDPTPAKAKFKVVEG